MENLNAEAVKKALECCTRSGCSASETPDCPLKAYEDCTTRLATDALALITSQEQRIKELTEENERLHASCTEFERKCASLNDENERLKSVEFTCGFVKPHKVLECPIFDEIARTKADTVRKMQERFIVEVEQTPNANEHFIKAWKEKIDQIAKAMLKGE